MSKNLTLTLNAAEIKHAVKADSYITGQIDKSADMVKNAALAFNEQAGDEQYHETKLFRTMKGALAKFEAQVAEYIETSDATASISDTLTSTATTFNIVLTVGDRTSGAFANTLAHLAQEYIINTMLYYWWQPIKPALAKDYIAFAADYILDVKRCLAKSAPTTTTTTYSDVTGSVTPINTGGGTTPETPNGGISPTDESALLTGVTGAPSDGLAFRIGADNTNVSLQYSGSASTFSYAEVSTDVDNEEEVNSVETGSLSDIEELLSISHDNDILVWIANASVAGQTLTITPNT